MKKSSVSVAEAKRRFSDLLGRAAYGKEIITITRRGRPMAKIVPLEEEPRPRHIRQVVGKIVGPEEFHQAIKDIVSNRRKYKPRLLRFNKD